MNRLTRRLGTVVAAAVVASPALALPATQASASVPTISPVAFGMHYLSTSHAFNVTFASARLWDMGVTWKDLQPDAPTFTAGLAGVTPDSSTDGFNQTAVGNLDRIVRTYAGHVDPMITLGMTPSWAANISGCNTVDNSGRDWGTQTCAPVDNYADSNGHSFGDPWYNYVSYLATRYDGHHADANGSALPKVTNFELWNEPNLRNGWNGSIAKLASMQQVAYGILHSHGQKLVSPSIPFTVGGAYTWLNSFLHATGGKSYDITGLHLYPSDAAAKGGYGPEWSMNTALVGARKVLYNNGVSGRQIWDTETNVGRVPAHTTIGGGSAGAAAVARTFILATENKIARTFWYAADEHSWGGVWLENTSYTALTTAGWGYQSTRARLVGKAPLGCSRTTVGTNKWKYTCKFGTTTGHKTLLAIWTTGGSYTLKAPAGTKHWYNVTGTYRSAYAGKKFTITHTPVYLVGSFK